MILQSIAAGWRGIRRHPGLVALIYAMNLVMALILSVPVYIGLGSTVGVTGFGQDLARGFDVVLWADIVEKASDILRALQFQLLWMVPLYLVWKAAAAVGLIHALRGDQVRSFWQGVGRYSAKALLLGIGFLILTLAGGVGIVIVVVVLVAVWPGEVGTFWTGLVIAPTLGISLLAMLDLMHDYARIALVVDDKSAWQALLGGLAWPVRHGRASWLYLAWFVPAAVLLLLPTLFDMTATAATGAAIWGLFLVQQVLMALRAAVTVGWFGSETALYEMVRLNEMPLIAAEETAEPKVVAPFADERPGAEPDGPALA